ncbi:MAG: outer membrane beta-barrel protein [Alistipes sp.]|nr:outer membrane beta-barrel protein [Alistipes sp.]
MRHSSAAILMALMVLFSAFTASAQRLTVSGRVVDGEAQPITYASVALTQNDKLITGCTSDIEGKFSLEANAGDYDLVISFIGYEYYKQSLALTESVDLGDITLTESSEQIEEVVVTSQLIRREADRFVVDVANSPLAMGKDGEELLKSSPGVWIQDDKISINGSSGSKIYLNDREVKLDDAQLIAYLRSLSANDIQRIEVIPQSGADYDASSSGGIIKITTRKRLDSGLMGSASLTARGSKGVYNVMPSVSLNYNRGKLNAYGRAWAGLNGSNYISTEHTDYTSGTIIDAASDMDDDSQWGGANVGVVYDINDKHSLGLEVQYNYYGGSDINNTWTEHTMADITTRTDGRYTSRGDNHMTTATLNYIYKLDDKGSTLKFIGDYTYSNSPDRNNYFDQEIDPVTLLLRDSTYRDNSLSLYQLGTATIALEKVLSPKVTLKAGVKYTYNNNSNSADYEYLMGETWIPNTLKNYDIGYTENIGAAYIIASAKLGRVSLVGGLRGEYTNFRDKAGAIAQNYFDLFPNANVSFALTKDYAYSLIAQYARTISRPSFWALSPNETKISEYMIQRGNPNLKPSYDNSVSVTAVLKYKYTITLGVKITENAIQQATIVDADNPELLILQTINYPTMNNYFASVNLPFQFTKWWQTNINLMGMYMGQRIYPDEPIRRNFMAYANAQMTFSLPKEFYIELSGSYMHGLVAGNTKLADMHKMNISVKKRLVDNKLTLKLGVDNIIPQTQDITIEEPTFKRVMTVDQPWMRPMVNFSISYNFNTGKQFRAKSVESGSADDLGRLGGGGGNANN